MFEKICHQDFLNEKNFLEIRVCVLKASGLLTDSSSYLSALKCKFKIKLKIFEVCKTLMPSNAHKPHIKSCHDNFTLFTRNLYLVIWCEMTKAQTTFSCFKKIYKKNF